MGYLLLAIDPSGKRGIYLASDALVNQYKGMGWTVWKVYPDGRKEKL